MHFDQTERIFAFPAELAGIIADLERDYGATAYYVPKRPIKPVKTICVKHDGSGWQAMTLGYNASPTSLTDGRLAYCALWSKDLVNALATDDRLSSVEEITEEELNQLKVTYKEL